MENMTKEQQEVMVAFGDSLVGERTRFLNQGVDRMEEVISHIVTAAFDSVNDLEGQEADLLKAHLINQMKEYTRRGLGRAIKRMAKDCEDIQL